MCVESETILGPNMSARSQSVLPVAKDPIRCARTPVSEDCRRLLNVHVFLNMTDIYVIFLFIFDAITSAVDVCQGTLRPLIL
jgi:hypothetical protein